MWASIELSWGLGSGLGLGLALELGLGLALELGLGLALELGLGLSWMCSVRCPDPGCTADPTATRTPTQSDHLPLME